MSQSVWRWIRSIFSRGGSDQFDAIKPDVEKLLATPVDSDADRDAVDEQVVAVLERLNDEINRIRRAAKGYPKRGGMAATDWMEGVGFADLSCALYEHFERSGWLQRAENASALWAKAVLAVCSHYHHMVGPAMLANADCQERLGNVDRATHMYRAVVGDFEFLLDDYTEGETVELDEDSRTAIESLDTAVSRLLELEPTAPDRSKLERLRARTSALLG